MLSAYFRVRREPGSSFFGFERAGLENDSGDARRPIRNAREKLSVASVARNMPSRTREMHCVRRCCWWLRGAWWEIRAGRRVGRRILDTVNT